MMVFVSCIGVLVNSDTTSWELKMQDYVLRTIKGILTVLA